MDNLDHEKATFLIRVNPAIVIDQIDVDEIKTKLTPRSGEIRKVVKLTGDVDLEWTMARRSVVMAWSKVS